MVTLKDAKTKRTSKGRRKIEIQKIENLSSRQVTFSKRRLGLFKKASELCIYTGAEIAIIARSQSNRHFSFGHPTTDTVINRFLSCGAEDCAPPVFATDYNLQNYTHACRELEFEKKRRGGENKGMWWCDEVEGKTLEELEEYAAALDELTNNVITRADELSVVQKYSNYFAPTPPMSAVDCSLDDTAMFVNQDSYNLGFESGQEI